jgi:hypothetical protein
MGVQNAVRDETQAAAFEVAGLSHGWSVPTRKRQAVE